MLDTAEGLEALARRVQVLEDKDAIRDVIHRYGYNADLGHFDDFVQTLTEDCVWDRSGGTRLPQGGVSRDVIVRGRDEAMASISGPHHQWMVGREQHLFADLIIEVDGDRATAVGHLAVPFKNEDQFMLLTCRVVRVRLVRTDGLWLISEIFFRGLGHPEAESVIGETGLLVHRR